MFLTSHERVLGKAAGILLVRGMGGGGREFMKRDSGILYFS